MVIPTDFDATLTKLNAHVDIAVSMLKSLHTFDIAFPVDDSGESVYYNLRNIAL